MSARYQIREEVAWLLWCANEGYLLKEDRAHMTNWFCEPVEDQHVDDQRDRPGWMSMADAVLAVLDQQGQEFTDPDKAELFRKGWQAGEASAPREAARYEQVSDWWCPVSKMAAGSAYSCSDCGLEPIHVPLYRRVTEATAPSREGP